MEIIGAIIGSILTIFATVVILVCCIGIGLAVCNTVLRLFE